MKTYVFSETEFSNVEDFYDAAVRNFGLSSDFGRNLDALWDAMSDESGLSRVETPSEIVWKSSVPPRLDETFKQSVFEIFASIPGASLRIE